MRQIGLWDREGLLLWALLLLTVWPPVTKAQATQAEVAALAQFRSFITSDPGNRLASWAAEDPCRYQGVTCGNLTSVPDQGATLGVAAINLSNLNLTGTISSALLNLTNLQVFNISHNNFYGPIPVGLQNLTALTSIDMSYNNLNGTVPASLLTTSEIRVLVKNNPNLCDPRVGTCGGNPTDGPVPEHSTDHGGNGLSGGAIFGIIVAVLLVGGVVAGGAFYYLRVYRKKRRANLNFERFTGMGVSDAEQY